MQDKSFSSLLLGNQWCSTWRQTPGCHVFILLDSSATLVFFPPPMCCGWIYGLTDIFQHTKHPSVDPYLVKFVFVILIKMDIPADQSTWGPVPWRWGLRLQMWTIVLQFFSPLHSTFLPIFFCSQSSVSLDCIWNYRSSYHSLKRLVCPALCILAVLFNPLVWTPVSLHFPH